MNSREEESNHFAKYVDYEEEYEKETGQKIENIKPINRKELEKFKNNDPPYFTSNLVSDIQKRRESLYAIAFLTPKIFIRKIMTEKDFIILLREQGWRFRALIAPDKIVFHCDTLCYLIITMGWISKPIFPTSEKKQVSEYADKIEWYPKPNFVPEEEYTAENNENEIHPSLLEQQEKDLYYLDNPETPSPFTGIIQSFEISDNFIINPSQ